MLKKLKISNYALIKELDVNFAEKFNVITGETGAGKSILIGALGLLAGNRADTSVLMEKEKKCIVEGTFCLERYKLNDFFEKNNLDNEKTTIIRREINKNGKSRAFINDTPVNLNTLKKIGENIIDIHSQHQNTKLIKSDYQLSLLDTFAKQNDKVETFGKEFQEYKKIEKYFNKLIEDDQTRTKEYDYQIFQLNEIKNANLQENEKQKLEQELTILNNADQIAKIAQQAAYLFVESEESICHNLAVIAKSFQNVSNLNSELKKLSERIKNSEIEINDIAAEIQSFANKIEVNQDKIEELNLRLQTIDNLLYKHNLKSVKELISLQKQLEQTTNKTQDLKDEIKKTKVKMEQKFDEIIKNAYTISKNRKKQIKNIQNRLLDFLNLVGIKDANIIIDLQQFDNKEVTSNGFDKINILFSANKGMEAQTINQVASGGELSRLLLGIKYLLADNVLLPTVVFDEIDTGVSGEIAGKVGQVMKDMAKRHQIIAITHLPQIAAKADENYFVYKMNENQKTHSLIKQLTKNEKILEIAKMISGKEPTKNSIENAKELMGKIN